MGLLCPDVGALIIALSTATDIADFAITSGGFKQES
jgi:hypothetical protein